MKTEIVVKKQDVEVAPVDDYVVIDRRELAQNLHTSIATGVKLLTKKGKFENSDFAKVKVMKTLSSFINAGVAMIQQESAQQRIELIKAKMFDMGYTIKNPKRLTGKKR